MPRDNEIISTGICQKPCNLEIKKKWYLAEKEAISSFFIYFFVKSPPEAEIFSIANGVPLHKAIHYLRHPHHADMTVENDENSQVIHPSFVG